MSGKGVTSETWAGFKHKLQIAFRDAYGEYGKDTKNHESLCTLNHWLKINKLFSVPESEAANMIERFMASEADLHIPQALYYKVAEMLDNL